jgi:hypothetical protein
MPPEPPLLGFESSGDPQAHPLLSSSTTPVASSRVTTIDSFMHPLLSVVLAEGSSHTRAVTSAPVSPGEILAGKYPVERKTTGAMAADAALTTTRGCGPASADGRHAATTLRVPLADPNAAPEIIAENRKYPAAVAVADQFVYWVDELDPGWSPAQIWRIAK